MISGVRKPVWSAEIADVETIDVSMHAVPWSIHDVMPSSSMSATMSRRSKSSGGMSSTTANMQKNESCPRKRYMRAEPYRMSRSASYCARRGAASDGQEHRATARTPSPGERACACQARLLLQQRDREPRKVVGRVQFDVVVRAACRLEVRDERADERPRRHVSARNEPAQGSVREWQLRVLPRVLTATVRVRAKGAPIVGLRAERQHARGLVTAGAIRESTTHLRGQAHPADATLRPQSHLAINKLFGGLQRGSRPG